jgi:hypothetical protein
VEANAWKRSRSWTSLVNAQLVALVAAQQLDPVDVTPEGVLEHRRE